MVGSCNSDARLSAAIGLIGDEFEKCPSPTQAANDLVPRMGWTAGAGHCTGILVRLVG
jgi:hypothetical protein